MLAESNRKLLSECGAARFCVYAVDQLKRRSPPCRSSSATQDHFRVYARSKCAKDRCGIVRLRLIFCAARIRGIRSGPLATDKPKGQADDDRFPR